jgi:hypothetical protein
MERKGWCVYEGKCPVPSLAAWRGHATGQGCCTAATGARALREPFHPRSNLGSNLFGRTTETTGLHVFCQPVLSANEFGVPLVNRAMAGSKSIAATPKLRECANPTRYLINLCTSFTRIPRPITYILVDAL